MCKRMIEPIGGSNSGAPDWPLTEGHTHDLPRAHCCVHTVHTVHTDTAICPRAQRDQTSWLARSSLRPSRCLVLSSQHHTKPELSRRRVTPGLRRVPSQICSVHVYRLPKVTTLHPRPAVLGACPVPSHCNGRSYQTLQATSCACLLHCQQES
ncbi:hypothetical protein BV25DRAFT_1829274 [Artomyces pyxidatus]|uniref:Uncharacterized protein n=1 Tax=Artomyces pyxidatus TaxID=48021 RepID=A0ACB8STN9_9AGAM|nr:hypothetical protein BV25DRAFT_1829274 [Artomyces pyxidatus]